MGSQVIVNNVLANDQTSPKVAALTGGGGVVVYTEVVAGNANIRAAVFDNNGVVTTPAFTVNNGLAGSQNQPQVAALHDGGFVVVWDDDNTNLLMGQRFDATANEVGAEFEKAGLTGVPSALASAHKEEASRHARLRDAHERTKRHHHALIARWKMLLRAITEPV